MKNAMNIPRILWAVLLLTTWTGLSAQMGVSSSDDQINTTTADRQSRPVAAQAGTGAGIIAWECASLDGDGFGIAAQRFNAPGTVSGGEIQINASATGHQRFPAVAMDDSGRHVVAWMDSEGSGDGWNIFTRVFAADGTALTTGGEASSSAAGTHRLPAVAMNDAGSHVVVWMSDDSDGDGFGIVARTFDHTGTATSSNIAVNDSTGGYQGHPAVAMDSAGNFVVVWQSAGYDGDGNGVFAKVYDASGNVSVAEFPVNTTTAGNQQEPSVGMDASGNLFISWSAWDATNDRYEIAGRRFALDGTALSGEFTVSSASVAHDHSHVAMTREGAAFVSYSSYGSDGSFHGVYLQGFDAAGGPNGSETAVNTTTSDFQQFSSGAWRRDSLLGMIAWQSGLDHATTTQDGDGYGIFTKTVLEGDNEAPTALCQDLTRYLNGMGTASISTADVDNGSTDNVGIDNMALDLTDFDCADTGTQVATLTVTDLAGNLSSCTSNITLLDSSAPSAVCQDISLALNANGEASLTVGAVDAGTSDNCSVATSISPTDFDCGDLGAHSVVLTAVDPSGNTASCTATVTVLDNELPTLNCQAATVVLNSAGTGSITLGDISSGLSDNCGIASYSIGQTNFDCSEVGTVAVALTATDSSGNTANCTANVTVQDNEAPVVSCQPVTAALNSSGTASITTGDLMAGVSDNCGIASLVLSQDNFDCNDLGSNNVTLTATDASGLTSTCSANVTVVDNEAPAVTCQNAVLVLNASGNATLGTSQAVTASSDNCGSPATSLSKVNFDCSDVGAQIITVTASDASGNTNTCTSSVITMDQTAPTLNCPSNVTYSCVANIPAPSAGAASVSDNCGVNPAVVVQDAIAGGSCASGTYIRNRTFIAFDNSGNTSNCTQTISVNVPTKIVSGDCIFCIAKVKVFPNCSNPSQVRVTSCQKMTKIALIDENGTRYNYSISTKDKTLTLPNGRIVKKIWVKSGCSSTNGNGFTHTFNLCNGSSKFDEDFGPSASDLARVSMEAFPNPTTGRINVQLSNSDASNTGRFEVKVIDMQGRTLITQDITLEGGYQELELDLGGLSNGLYYLVADGEDQRLTEKIVKQ